MYCIYVYRFRSLSYMLVFAHMVQYFKVLWSCFSIRILGYPVFLTDLYERERERLKQPPVSSGYRTSTKKEGWAFTFLSSTDVYGCRKICIELCGSDLHSFF